METGDERNYEQNVTDRFPSRSSIRRMFDATIRHVWIRIERRGGTAYLSVADRRVFFASDQDTGVDRTDPK